MAKIGREFQVSCFVGVPVTMLGDVTGGYPQGVIKGRGGPAVRVVALQTRVAGGYISLVAIKHLVFR